MNLVYFGGGFLTRKLLESAYKGHVIKTKANWAKLMPFVELVPLVPKLIPFCATVGWGRTNISV